MENIKTMQDYARKLRKKFPHMKHERLTRKVAEYFHVTLINEVKSKPPAVPIKPPENTK